MRQLTAEQLQKSASVLAAMSSSDALAILQCLLDTSLTVTYDALVEETGLALEQVRTRVEKLAEAGILVRHNAPVFHNPDAGFAYLSEDMPALAECVVESLWSDLIRKYQVAS